MVAENQPSDHQWRESQRVRGSDGHRGQQGQHRRGQGEGGRRGDPVPSPRDLPGRAMRPVDRYLALSSPLLPLLASRPV